MHPIRHGVLFAVVACLLSIRSAPAYGPWHVISPQPGSGISGMATLQHHGDFTRYFVAIDSKDKTSDRIGLLTVQIGPQVTTSYSRLPWPSASLPRDLESASAGTEPRTFYVLTSTGALYLLKLAPDDRSAKLLRNWNIPNKTGIPSPNYESFVVKQLGNRLLAVWAHRGNTADPAVICWSTFDSTRDNPFGPIQSAKLSVPWPKTFVRHASDAKVDSAGNLYVTAAYDPDNDGPFASALYLVGRFMPAGWGFQLQLHQPHMLYCFGSNKAEGMELLEDVCGNRTYVATSDDENLGASYWQSCLPAAW